MTRRPAQKALTRAHRPQNCRRVQPGLAEVRLQHEPREFVERRPRLPAELAPGLRCVAAELVDLGRAEVARIDLDVSLPVEACEAERFRDELPDAVHLAGCDDKVVRCLVLEHQPHRFDVLGRVAPVSAGIQVAEEQLLLPSREDCGDRSRDLAGDEGLAAAR